MEEEGLGDETGNLIMTLDQSKEVAESLFPDLHPGREKSTERALSVCGVRMLTEGEG